ncbi:hypothetical protein Aph02nite_52800 [Actinoplanes philippinensis]|uniref:DUF2809 domain-containing protein n=1 Tax=Actinoplanes philippinensis TaxID=35752 RepID=A0A1I2IMD7_9ACTN|nr:DUF2809 domain-containing protein [Actinoplanes philippinensis]GIE79330.1 hypothetical protein Aph02nite_52800 [Actinoplanes philippinensis]SFF42006.1 Protein of unknown function [Actinoplanes philippinensis]
MSISHRRLRLAMLGAVLGFLAAALAIRAVAPLGGLVEQSSGTTLYASMIWAGVRLTAPRLGPFAVGGVALAWCWGAEVFQLTGIPAALSAESLIARLVLGAAFDPVDLIWYPVGVVPLVIAHRWARRRTAEAAGGPAASSISARRW